ncbi:hypothetical protein FHR72_000444 [Mycolicibacterium iranicum]|uniref:DUF4189 domain-containing protein n=1 Tax=Mycolicibacterium iranicum TaxID=912594 RepID=A0A839PZR8_MYCIR|nr:DUF4189 domain-containing protein [Mycolicibacterium iranicum]MBB2988987.1 hypothetical protein [Mycolicibacterium iranicum]
MLVNSWRTRVAVLATAPLAALGVSLVGIPTANAELYYGAIAYADNGAGASTWNYPTRRDAEQAAVDYCGYSSCDVLSSFSECGAVAFDGSRLYGGTGRTLALAQLDALNNLGGGWIELWACNN